MSRRDVVLSGGSQSPVDEGCPFDVAASTA